MHVEKDIAQIRLCSRNRRRGERPKTAGAAVFWDLSTHLTGTGTDSSESSESMGSQIDSITFTSTPTSTPNSPLFTPIGPKRVRIRRHDEPQGKGLVVCGLGRGLECD